VWAKRTTTCPCSWTSPAKCRQTSIEANMFFRVAPAHRLRGAPMESGNVRPSDDPGSNRFLRDFSEKSPFFGRAGPSGLNSLIGQVGIERGGYIGISRSVACGRSGGLRFLGYGIRVRVTTPPHCLQHSGGFSFGLGRQSRSSRYSRSMSRLQLPCMKP
jgi:hypothetical protein